MAEQVQNQKETEIQEEMKNPETGLAKGLKNLWENTNGAEPIYAMVMCTDRFDLLKICDAAKKNAEKTIDDEMLNEKLKNIWSDEGWKDEQHIFNHLLDLRLFSENGEVRWFRSTVNRPFVYRKKLNDSEYDKDGKLLYWDEEQFLDIDDARTEAKRELEKTDKLRLEKDQVLTMGGGMYSLPVTSYRKSKRKEEKDNSTIVDVVDEKECASDEKIHKNLKVKIRNYLDYDEIGQCYIKDWRIVGFRKSDKQYTE